MTGLISQIKVVTHVSPFLDPCLGFAILNKSEIEPSNRRSKLCSYKFSYNMRSSLLLTNLNLDINLSLMRLIC